MTRSASLAEATPLPLAVLGGNPLFARPRQVGMPFIPSRGELHESLDEILNARSLTNNGPLVRRLEHLMAERHGVSEAVAICNASIGLQLLLRATGVKGEVIMPSFTYIATAHAATWEGLKVRFVDINPESHCLDPAGVRAALNRESGAIVGVNLWGQMCAVEALAELAHHAGIPLLLDSAQALGCRVRHQTDQDAAGRGALASVISLHATKIISGLEGGAILTNHKGLADVLRKMRNHGMDERGQVVALGTNAKLNEFAAAFAMQGLTSLDQLIERNKNVRRGYQETLAGLPGIQFHEPQQSQSGNHHYAVLMVMSRECPLSRDELRRTLWAENVQTKRYFYPGCHRSHPYASQPGIEALHLPVSEAVGAQVLVMPAGSAVTLEDVERISGRIRLALRQHEEVRKQLQRNDDTLSLPG
jgi:dTDP-4-amino-4,6-dideoxygalactose transaminase